MTSAVTKLIGMSFPCHAGVCLLKFPRLRQELDLKGSTSCPAHQKEYEEIARTRGFH
jgi:hypothetical protein